MVSLYRGVYWRQTDRQLPHDTPFIPYVPERWPVFRHWARNYWPAQLRRLVHDAGFDIAHTGFGWQTFDNISGRQPRALRQLKGTLRQVAAVGERTPVVRQFDAVSQFVAAVKPLDRN